jgi:hypothetical protein
MRGFVADLSRFEATSDLADDLVAVLARRP